MSEHERAVFELKGIAKSFGHHRVLKNLSLDLAAGDFVLLLGANGSGKSTLLRICIGLSRADSGEIVSSGNPQANISATDIGHAGHPLFLYKNLSVRENIKLFCDVADKSLDVESYLNSWLLYSERDKLVAELSKGLQYRVSLCRAFIHSPRFLFLDEPTSSLDEASTELLFERISAIFEQSAGGGFVVIATHDVRRLRKYANRILVLKDGVIARDLSDMQRSNPGSSLEDLKDQIIDYYVDSNR